MMHLEGKIGLLAKKIKKLHIIRLAAPPQGNGDHNVVKPASTPSVKASALQRSKQATWPTRITP